MTAMEVEVELGKRGRRVEATKKKENKGKGSGKEGKSNRRDGYYQGRLA